LRHQRFVETVSLAPGSVRTEVFLGQRLASLMEEPPLIFLCGLHIPFDHHTPVPTAMKKVSPGLKSRPLVMG
jgi:hypothetical protein